MVNGALVACLCYQAAQQVVVLEEKPPERAGHPQQHWRIEEYVARRGPRRQHATVSRQPARAAKGISIWLKAEFDVLMKRIRRRQDRPLLRTEDPAATLRKLMEERDPTYALADLTVQSRDVLHEKIVDEIVSGLAGQMRVACAGAGQPSEGDPRP